MNWVQPYTCGKPKCKPEHRNQTPEASQVTMGKGLGDLELSDEF